MFNWFKRNSSLGYEPKPSHEYVIVEAPYDQVVSKSPEDLARWILDQALVEPSKDSRLYYKNGGVIYSVQTDYPELRDEIVRICSEDDKYKHLSPYYLHNYQARFFRKAEHFR